MSDEIEEFTGPDEFAFTPAGEHVALARQLAELRLAIGNLQSRLKPLEEQEKELERRLFDELENLGLRKITVTGLGTFSLSDLAWARIEDPIAALEWAQTQGPTGLITLNHSRLTAIVRENLGADEPLPAGIGYSVSRTIRWSRR